MNGAVSRRTLSLPCLCWIDPYDFDPVKPCPECGATYHICPDVSGADLRAPARPV